MNAPDPLSHAVALYPDVLRHASYITECREDAQELTQDAYMRLLSMVDRLDERAETDRGMRAVVYRIVDNLWIDQYRRRRVQIVPLADIRLATKSEHTGRIHDHLDCARLLATLPSDQRNAALAVYIYGFTQAEYSEAVGMPLGTVKKRCIAAKQGLRRAWRR